MTVLRLPALLLAFVVAVTGLAAVSAGPARASDRAPRAGVPTVSKSFGAAVDAAGSWERESTCSPTEKPGAKALRRLLLTTYRELPSIGSNIVRSCSRSDSGHEEGRALDWMTSVRNPAQRATAEAFLGWLQAPDAFGNPEVMARRLGIAYLIWNNRTWRPGDPERGWVEYDGCLAPKKRERALDTTCHRDHVHISLTWDGALKRTSYYTGFVACPPSPEPEWVEPDWPVEPDPAYPTDPTLPPSDPTLPHLPTLVAGPTVPLAPVVVFASRSGIGAPAGPCRVHPDYRLDLPVLGVGGVPADGVAALVLRVRVLRPDAPATLRAWPGGTDAPVESMPPDAGGRFADVTVQLGTAGTAGAGIVSLALGGGMGHLRVAVVGYQPLVPVL